MCDVLSTKKGKDIKNRKSLTLGQIAKIESTDRRYSKLQEHVGVLS